METILNSKQIVVVYTTKSQVDLADELLFINGDLAATIPGAVDASKVQPCMVAYVSYLCDPNGSPVFDGYFENDILLSFDGEVPPLFYIIFENSNLDKYALYQEKLSFLENMRLVHLPHFTALVFENQEMLNYMIDYFAEERRNSLIEQVGYVAKQRRAKLVNHKDNKR